MPFVDPRKIQEGTGGFGRGGAGGRVRMAPRGPMPKAEPRMLEQHAKPARSGARSLVKEGGKGFGEQKFSVDVPVKVRFPDGEVHTDRVKGLNVGHALARARDNWPGATVTRGAGEVIKRVRPKK